MSDEVTEAPEVMGPPGPEHKRFEPFVGTFRARVKVWMGPGDPMLSTGTMTNTMELGGRFLRQDYVGDANPGPFDNFEGHGYWGYNTTSSRYEGFWIDTASTMMQTESGTVDESGKVWTMTGEMTDLEGTKITKRSVITLEDSDHHRLEMFFVKGDEEFRGMEIDYERVD